MTVPLGSLPLDVPNVRFDDFDIGPACEEHSDDAVYLLHDGKIIALAGGPLSMGGMPRTTERLSHLEFNGSAWDVIHPRTRAVLYTHEDYNAAHDWERNHFNQLLGRCSTAEEFNSLTIMKQ